ncbi:MAG: hypothetical protein P8174_00960 [Gemmatimonadota bacterium]|jgi:hypothetical protein
MSEDRFTWMLRRAAKDYNAPPETPREEMWAVIRERLHLPEEAPAADTGPTDSRVIRLVPRRWVQWSVALAATLAIGFGLGRLTRTAEPGATAPAMLAGKGGAGSAATTDNTALPFRLAATDHLGQAEALLTVVRGDRAGQVGAQTVDWARNLLSTTRLLLDSPAGRDPQLAPLLEDLELVLVQIANVQGSGSNEDLRMIRESMQHNNLLSKLQTVVSAGSIQSTI